VFSCHLELFLPSSLYGFSIFIEEMSLGGSQGGGCRRDYLQFGRDILFLTTHKSRKYCGQVEPPVSTQRKEGVTGFTFPLTPLANRIYSEEDDMEMDVWLQIDLANARAEGKSLTLVVTPFKKSCASRDLLYRQCRYSTKCVRKELFCDGRINCAWPYSDPADEVYCQSPPKEPESSPWSVNDIPVILLVLFLVLSLLLALACGLRRFSHQQKEKAKKKRGGESERRADRMRPQDLIILASALPPPPPYTEELPEAPPSTLPPGPSCPPMAAGSGPSPMPPPPPPPRPPPPTYTLLMQTH